MNSTHSPEHDEVLRELMTGSDDRQRLLSSLSQCSRCQERLGELELVVRRLASVRDVSLDVIEPLAPFPAGEEVARRRLLELAAQEFPALAVDQRRASRSRPMLAVLAAAAAVLAIVILAREWPRDPEAPGEHLIGIGDIEVVGPKEDAGPSWSGVTFSWSGELKPREAYVLIVWDEDGRELTRQPLDKNSWQVPPDTALSWPAAIRWQVRVEHESLEKGDEKTSQIIAARLSP